MVYTGAFGEELFIRIFSFVGKKMAPKIAAALLNP